MSDQQLSLFTSPRPGYGSDRGKRSYHVRGQIPGQAYAAAAEIKSGERKARQQEDAILAFYRANAGAWGPSHVWRRTMPTVLLTSVRRGITNLTDRKLLRMTDERRPGPFGAMEHLWELNRSEE